MVQRFGFSAARAQWSYIRDNADRLFICATAPASYSAASNQPQMIASANVSSDDWTLTSGGSGPRLIFNQKTLTIEGSGSASHIVFARSSGSTVLVLTDCCGGPVLSSGNTITVPTWTIDNNIGDFFQITVAQQGHTIALPLTERNLIKFPEALDGSTGYWQSGSQMSTAEANVTAAPDGSSTADKLRENGAAGAHHWSTSAAAIQVTAHYNPLRLQVYAKRGDSQADWIKMMFSGDANATVTFPISATAASPIMGTRALSADSTQVGDGWYLLRAWVSASAGGHGFRLVFQTSGVGGNPVSYQGTLDTGNFFWRAMVITSAG